LNYKDSFVPRGSIALIFFNVYSSLLLKSCLTTVVFDPVKLDLDKHNFGAKGVDVIVITHEHADHLEEKLALEMQRRSRAAIMTTPFVAGKLERVGGEAKGLRVGDSVKIKDMTFYAEHCVHPANQPLSFIIKTGAITIYHPDDSEPFSGMKEIQSKYGPDMMLYAGTSKKELIEITEMVRPQTVVSCFDAGFADLKIPGVELRIVRQFETFRYP